MYFAGNCTYISVWVFAYMYQKEGRGTYVRNNCSRSNQPRQRKPITNLLNCRSRRPQRGRRHIRPAIIIHHASNRDIHGRDEPLADEHGAGVQPRLAHFRRDGEERRCAGEGKDERGDGGDGVGEGWVGDDFVVGCPGAGSILRCAGGTVLDADCDGYDENCGY